jgi:TatA/E family protein of Tat protein translocase
MLSLSPAKLLVVLVIALLVLGPEKLPGVAHQLGAAWSEFRRWRAKLESEVRGVFPDLPPTHEVAQAVPLAFLDRLADQHAAGTAGEVKPEPSPASGNGANGTAPGDGAPVNGSAGASNGSEAFSPWSVPASGDLADDPSMN